ncbi:hypothetical protein A3K86_07560 [Photobacterium jeanii]|uniref:Uncharacterized protein n=1 Tax=Photobacterium jeanii TaxID=858640 RepID=A0A178KN93_9GAMM|nr:hypothetical protein A3K86_07560 [Photobacterium jeanii]
MSRTTFGLTTREIRFIEVVKRVKAHSKLFAFDIWFFNELLIKISIFCNRHKKTHQKVGF